MNKDELKEIARRYGIKYWYEMKKHELIVAIKREENKIKEGKKLN